MNKIFVTTLLACGFLLSGCGASGEASSPKDVAQQYVTNLSGGNLDQASLLTVSPSDNQFKKMEQGAGTNQIKAIKDLFKHTKIVLGNEHVNGDSASVDATVTSLNIGQIMAKMLQDELSSAPLTPGSTPSPDEMAQEMDKAINDPSIPDQTNSAAINLTKTSNGWKVSSDNSQLATAILGGATQMFNTTNSTN